MKRLFAILLFCVLVPCAYGETITYKDGSTYAGDVVNGQSHGQGTLLYFTGDKYVGEFKNGKPHGQGTLTWAKGEKAVGEFKNGQPHGQVTYTEPKGDLYVGEFRNGKQHGYGTYIFPDGSNYEGEWKEGLHHGKGTLNYADGSNYEGEWKEGLHHGKGERNFADGGKYIGEWKRHKAEGQGTRSLASGLKDVGIFKNSKTWNGIRYNRHGQIIGTIINGKLCQGCKPQTTTTNVLPTKKAEPRLKSSGTGFAVNRNYIVTAYHVIDECRKVTIRHAHANYQAKVIASDVSNDLGLLRLGQSISTTAKLRGGRQVRLGDRVATYGYPLFGSLSDSAKITQGDINSLAGMKNNSSRFQYDAPTQSGNSGGPVLDFSGNVVGVVVSGLDNAKTQTVNFAVKSYLVEGFLSSNNVSFEKAESTEKLELPDIAEKAEKFTVLVGCWE